MTIYIGSRYETATVVGLQGGDGMTKATVFRGPSPYTTDRYSRYLVAEGDRLDRLASRFYGDPNLWWVIADANAALMTDPLVPGTVLRIPDGRDVR